MPGARSTTAQPAARTAPIAKAAWRTSSSEPAAQEARRRTKNIVLVS
jgi:hypothetical protein